MAGGPRDPEVQADPEEAQIPRSSSSRTEGLPLNALETDVDVPRQVVVPVPVEGGVGNGRQAVYELVPQGGDFGGVGLQVVTGGLEGSGQAHNAGHILRPGPLPALLGDPPR